jgi:nicotinamide-nucleotide amidase
MTLNDLSKTIGKLLTKKKLTLSICESCTGGMLGEIITTVPGSSKYFVGGIIAYSDKVKRTCSTVRTATLEQYGAVSAEVAQEMATGVRKKLKTDIGMSITGIAGPTGGTKKKPVGLVYIALLSKRNSIVKHFFFTGMRETVRKKACREALSLLHRSL